MTSIEALKDLKKYFDYHKDDEFKVIENDLEVLEIIRTKTDIIKFLDSVEQFSKLTHYDVKKIKKWLWGNKYEK